MRNAKKVKAMLIGLAVAAIPLVTTATCSPGSGRFDFYRNDHHHDSFLDVIVDDGCWFYEDCYDDYYYYEEIIIYD